MSHGPSLRAAIFDLDGTLVDNMSFHAKAWVETSRQLGLTLTAERFERDFAGKKNDEIFPLLLGRPVEPSELARLAEQKESLYRSLYAPHLRPIAGARELLERLARAGVRLALGTAAPEANRTFVLDGLGLRGFFTAITGPEQVARGKPFPDLFLLAARTLDIAPEDCVVFEDAVNGVLAARSAGMVAAGLTTTTTAEALRQAGARWTMRDLSALPEELKRVLLGANG